MIVLWIGGVSVNEFLFFRHEGYSFDCVHAVDSSKMLDEFKADVPWRRDPNNHRSTHCHRCRVVICENDVIYTIQRSVQ